MTRPAGPIQHGSIHSASLASEIAFERLPALNHGLAEAFRATFYLMPHPLELMAHHLRAVRDVVPKVLKRIAGGICRSRELVLTARLSRQRERRLRRSPAM